ncbi:MAG: 3' terminal RNA ribose 2'-O-methyltransferase Hen1 [Aeromicrobium erythreum]
MLLTITADRTDELPVASDLGFLLHKHPDRVQSTDVFGGRLTVFYPEVGAERCTVALLLEVDPIALVKGRRRGGDGFSLAQYVNDRPYAATSMLSVAMGKVLRTALRGRCDARPDLVGSALSLAVSLPALPGGTDLVRRLFDPLGWSVDARPIPLDDHLPQWGDSPYSDVTLRGVLPLADALNHLYVLIPVLDDAKHYWVGTDEVEKLVRAGDGWLQDHPERELVTRRYLAHQRSMVDEARTRLAEIDGLASEPTVDEDRPRPLVALRHDAVLDQVDRARPSTVLDLGCGQGALVRGLLEVPGVQRVVGTEVSDAALRVASRRLGVDRMSERQAARLDLLLSSLQYQDERLVGFDLAVLMEVIEHVDPDRVPAVTANVFGFMRPGRVVVTTPNREHNVRYPALVDGGLRHPDHRFEWTRAELTAWADATAERYGYTWEHLPVGDHDPEVGAPTQMAVFTRTEEPA